MIETKELYTKLETMTEEERISILDPICEAVTGKVTVYENSSMEILANRIFALAVLDLYRQWQQESYERK
jgi:DNA replication initiation complex subunit (GINS family)